jgi:secreted trypsin-like serine protease
LFPLIQNSLFYILLLIKNNGFNQIEMLNDIALLKLRSNAILNEYVQIACLPYSSYIAADTVGWAVGWGVTVVANNSLPDLEQEVDLTVYDESACNETANLMKKDWKSQLCAGDLNGKKDTCQGDSGGPLYVRQTFNNVTKVINNYWS